MFLVTEQIAWVTRPCPVIFGSLTFPISELEIVTPVVRIKHNNHLKGLHTLWRATVWGLGWGQLLVLSINWVNLALAPWIFCWFRGKATCFSWGFLEISATLGFHNENDFFSFQNGGIREYLALRQTRPNTFNMPRNFSDTCSLWFSLIHVVLNTLSFFSPQIMQNLFSFKSAHHILVTCLWVSFNVSYRVWDLCLTARRGHETEEDVRQGLDQWKWSGNQLQTWGFRKAMARKKKKRGSTIRNRRAELDSRELWWVVLEEENQGRKRERRLERQVVKEMSISLPLV